MEKTFAIIKPRAVKEGHVDDIVAMIKADGFTVDCMETITITQEQAQELYVEHKERPFFGEMVETMTASPVVVMQLSKEGAVKAWRDLMGATNPAEAEAGTVRAKFGKSIGENATHGSDSLQSAERELGIFFKNCK
ncbi:MAG: nucleoside-diphosphate kinase [Epsilonproteobacteria bacterium]|nr:nucleoside-diphosphate kinase [Campylobacterota bacterium]|tara:strand:- start:1836 stop:2243 length:408 start_codon:yes stop_codon:yes gene_type:complete